MNLMAALFSVRFAASTCHYEWGSRVRVFIVIAFLSTVAATYAGTVTNLNDSGPGSLRQAIADAASGETITFAPGLTGTITLSTGKLAIAKNLTIQGPGPNKIAIDANYTAPVFYITLGVVSISGLTITHGDDSNFSPFFGGGIIHTGGSLDVINCVISGNTSVGGAGGIFNQAAMNLTNSTVIGNYAYGAVGGIFNYGVGGAAVLNINNSTISGNYGVPGNFAYGGILNEIGAHLQIINSTIADNVAPETVGGGIVNWSTLTITSSTITGNSSGASGALTNVSVQNVQGTSTIKSSIIALNTSSPPNSPDVNGTFVSGGNNLIGKKDGSTGFTAATDKTGTIASPLDPKLDPNGLQHNGGLTETVALLVNSPAINAGPASGAPARDQRGYVRNGTPDIGAVEFGGMIPNTLGNISTRGFVQTGNDVLIGGLIVTGGGPKKVIVRALGPTLGKAPFNIPNSMSNPRLDLFDSNNALLASNDNWGTASNAAAISSSGYPPPDGKESAILTNLNPGNYTAIVRGANNTTGIALVEGYDLDFTAGSKLGNISTRSFVGTGNNVMISGVIVHGPDSESMIIRGLGPTLSQFQVPSVLADPMLDLRDANGNALMINDNWKSSQQAQIQASGHAPPNDLEPAIAITLSSGNYTAILSGKNSTTGNALVEVYALN